MPDGYDYATECRHCGTTYYPNMYGMGRCSGCGYQHHRIDLVHEMKLNENWNPPTKEQPVGMIEEEGDRGFPGAVTEGQVPGRNFSSQVTYVDFLDDIEAGKWDKQLKDIAATITKRERARKEAVMAQVTELWGEGASINVSRTPGVK